MEQSSAPKRKGNGSLVATLPRIFLKILPGHLTGGTLKGRQERVLTHLGHTGSKGHFSRDTPSQKCDVGWAAEELSFLVPWGGTRAVPI